MSCDEMSTSSHDSLFTQPWQIDTKANDDMSTSSVGGTKSNDAPHIDSMHNCEDTKSNDDMSTSSVSSHEQSISSESSHEHENGVPQQNNDMSIVINIHGMPPCDS